MKTTSPLLKRSAALLFCAFGGLHLSAFGQSATSLAPCWSAAGDQPYLVFGGAVGKAGDVNGDGFDDIIVGSTSRAYVFYGSAAGLSPAADWSVPMLGDESANAQPVGGAGDVNGDGYADVIVGSKEYRVGTLYPVGKVEVYYGSSNGLEQTPSWVVIGQVEGVRLGFAVSSAGDVNRDGYDDIIVGSAYGNAAYLYYGSADGLSESPAWTARGLAESYFGSSLAAAGDVNGDGYDDVLVGAHNEWNEPPGGYGRAFLYYGGPGGLQAQPVWNASPAGAWMFSYVVSSGDVNRDGYSDIIVGSGGGLASVYYGSPRGPRAEPDWSVTGTHADSSYGVSVAGAGDIDGDGFFDMLVGASEYLVGLAPAGQVYLFRGSANGLATRPSWTGSGEQSDAHYGGKVNAAGDVNGDGKADFIVGQWGFDIPDLPEAGRVFVYCGETLPELPELPVVTIRATDPVAAEQLRGANTATFVVRRSEPTDSELVVSYAIRGTAVNGVDYLRLRRTVTIPAGVTSARITITPLQDGVREQRETVVLRLEPAANYAVGRPSTAVSVIEDRSGFLLRR